MSKAKETSIEKLLLRIEELQYEVVLLQDRLYASRDREECAIENLHAIEYRIAQSIGPHPADPDPYGYHGLSRDHRQLYIEHYMRTGEWRP